MIDQEDRAYKWLAKNPKASLKEAYISGAREQSSVDWDRLMDSLTHQRKQDVTEAGTAYCVETCALAALCPMMDEPCTKLVSFLRKMGVEQEEER